MKTTTTVLLSLLAAVPYVSAHGFVSQVVVNGQTYQGNNPGGDTSPSPIRQISTISPVKGATNKDMFCGYDAQVASEVATADPGSKVTFTWSGGDGQNWPHNTGPLMTYMGACEGTTCDKYTATDTKWFKIDEVGKEANDSSTWVQQEIMNRATYTVTLPSNIEPGDYLIRHEIIALHLATSMGGAEFYPSCTQVRVTGNGNGTPNQTVSFPGAYSDSDPGIYDPNVYDPGSSYVFPGPPLSNLVSGDTGTVGGQGGSTASATGSGAASATASASGSQASPTGGTVAAAPGSGKCSLKAHSVNTTQGNLNANYPRHFSRVMKRLLNDFQTATHQR
ncbi:lytic polysaccharide monooxygenase [Neolentinus lepideus HHB14362 ss-1]|uniref:lytic cellulose monooxygenase (C4-dehydrogenating) n=1 Tax=Neolentinus lepideus HHB14362 ss-1 TaxID=1314782 RepID=A0A165RVZ0_9AGAM|nr:lytic polysaccharide monooxygenase [Neolentinus lepideus HHB14362 ss-1]